MMHSEKERKAKEKILKQVDKYCKQYHTKAPYQEGDRIPYASRVYDSDEMCNLVDSALEFWLTSGRYTDEFEKKFAEYLGVRHCSLVNCSVRDAFAAETRSLPSPQASPRP